MTFYLIGTGLSDDSLTNESIKILKSCDEIYLENYTVNFPYPISNLEKNYNIKIKEISRKDVEDESIIEKAKNSKVALLVYGDSLSATTHMQLIQACLEKKVGYKIFPNASILNAVSLTGLQPYKFGKTTSLPDWAEHKNKPKSFMNVIQENKSVDAHTLILSDIGLNLENALNQLTEAGLSNEEEIIILSNAANNSQKILFDKLKNLNNKNAKMPFCIIIPSKMHFSELDSLELLKD